MGLPPSCCKAGRHGTPPLLQFTAGLLPSWRRLATKPWGSCYHCVGALRATKAQAGMVQRSLYFATFLLYCCYYSIYFLLPILRRGFPARSPEMPPAMSPIWVAFATLADYFCYNTETFLLRGLQRDLRRSPVSLRRVLCFLWVNRFCYNWTSFATMV
jgi:hypothetical protein